MPYARYNISYKIFLTVVSNKSSDGGGGAWAPNNLVGDEYPSPHIWSLSMVFVGILECLTQSPHSFGERGEIPVISGHNRTI